MFYTALWALLSHWARHHFQLAMLLLGLSVATALWSGVQVINVEARASYARAANSLGPVSLMRVAFPDQRPISLELYAQMRREGWLVSPVIEGLISDTGVTVMGLDPLTLPDQAMLGQGVPMDVSSILSQQNRLFVNAQTAQRLADRDVGVLEVVPDLADAMAIADIGVAQGLLNKAEIS
jgi:putative ABC transport system permease protein